MGSSNHGIIVSGPGRIEAGAIAAGPNARASGSLAHAPELRDDRLEAVRRELDALRRAISEHGADLPQADELRGAAEQVGKEIGAERPNRISVNALLNGIVEGAKSVSAVATAASAVKAAVAAVL